MRLFTRFQDYINLLIFPVYSFLTRPVFAQTTGDIETEIQVVEEGKQGLGFNIPSFGDILTFIIRAFFVVAGIFALVYLLLGAFSWITSGGDKDKVEKAKDKIQAALIGVILIIIVIAIVATLEQIVFGGNLCFGLTCPLSIPTLLEPPK